jgi:hypothetical protein
MERQEREALRQQTLDEQRQALDRAAAERTEVKRSPIVPTYAPGRRQRRIPKEIVSGLKPAAKNN